MFTRPIIATAIAAAAIAAFATPAAAQQGRTTATTAPRVVAHYSFGASHRSPAFPSTITVTDSAGTLVASARMSGVLAPIPMLVHVIENDLVLEGTTPEGILTVVLDKQAAGGTAKVAAGRWSLGKSEGRLRARA